MLMFFWLLDSLMTFMLTSLPVAMEHENQEKDAYQFYTLAVWERYETLCGLDDPDPLELWESQKVIDAHYACTAVRDKWHLDWLYTQRRRSTIKLARAFITKYMPIPEEQGFA